MDNKVNYLNNSSKNNLITSKVLNHETTIFDGLDKLEKKDLQYQIATLEMMTLKNILGNLGKNAYKKSMDAVNFSRTLLKKDEISVKEVESIESQISQRAEELNNKNNYALQKLLRDTLYKKVTSVRRNIDRVYTDKQLSDEVINLAALNFKKRLAEDLSIAEKADQVQILYFQRLQEQTMKNMKNQSNKEKAKTEKTIQDELDTMSQQQSDELKEALGLKELTGSTVRSALLSGGSGAVTMLAIEGAGFGAYVALSTIIHAVFTTTLGITVPFAAYTGAASILSFITGPAGWLVLGGSQVFMLKKNHNKLVYELLAQVVWLSVQKNGKFYAETSSMDLPDHMNDFERDRKVKLQKEQADLQAQLATMQLDLDKVMQRMVQDKQKLQSAEMQRVKYQNEIKIIEQKLINSANQPTIDVQKFELEKQSLENQLKKKNIEIVELEEEYYKTYQENLDKNFEFQALQQEYANVKTENEALKEENEAISAKNDYKIDRFAKKLEENWTLLFSEMQFHPSVFREVATNFHENEVPYIERTLLEMIKVDDPRSLPNNRGKMHNTGLEHISFKNNANGRIFYEIRPQSGPQTIYIDSIVKHNDSRYGKARK